MSHTYAKAKARVFLSAAIMSITGCATVNVPMTVEHPAEINMTPYKQIAIGEFRGNQGDKFASQLKNDLDASGGGFQMVDRSRLNQIMKELHLSQSDLVNEKKRIKLGKFLSAAALITGSNEGSYAEQVTFEDTKCITDKATVVQCRRYTRSGVWNTSGSVDVIDVQTGQIIKSKVLDARCVSSTEATNSQPGPIDRFALEQECVQRNVSTIRKAISPWQETVQAAFETDKAIPELEAGIAQCKIGEMQEGIKLFNQGAQAAEGNAAVDRKSVATAYWDLGLAYEYTDDFDRALDSVKKAYSFDTSDTYASEIAKIKRRTKERTKLKEQGL